MEDEIQLQAQACKFPRLGNGTRNESNNKIGSSVREQYPPPDEKEDGGELGRRNGVGSTTNHNFQSSTWHHSSRIIRVSRASGGKDRHSKVMTSKGLRDRRVRLSVTTAIQFYDLQDRLGYDQPSKAVEWLIKAASDAISELPSLNNTFPETPNQQPSNEKRQSDDQQNQSQNLSLSKSACSSNSETSKGSGLSLSRSEIRVKARERARERASKEKENESNIHHNVKHHNHNHMSQSASFTELLTGGIGSSTVTVPTTTTSPYSTVTPMDYFSSGLLVGHSSSRTHQSSSAAASASSSSGFSGQIQLGHSHSHCLQVSPFSGENENHSDHQMQHFPFMNEHLMPPHHVVTCPNSCSQPSGSDYNLNFTISSGLAGYNRGTLQSNSPSLLPHLQRFSTMDGSSTTSNNLPFFIGAAAPTMDNHHHLQFSPVFDGRLQLCYGDGSRHSDQKGKSNKN